jgi:hypothetical protein
LPETVPIRLYPNPNTGAFTVTGDFSASAPAELVVRDVLGKAVHTTQLVQVQSQLQLTLPAGVYTATITPQGGVPQTLRVVVQNR